MKLFVGNLAFHTTEDVLQSAFSEFGDVTEVKVVLDRETGRSRGFAFVRMATEDAGRRAMEQMNGAVLDGRSLRVNEAEERAGGGGFGGGGGGRGPGGGGFGGGGGGRGGGGRGGDRGGDRGFDRRGGGGGGGRW